MAPARGNTDTAAEDERVGGESWVVPNGPIDGGDAHLVAVILHAGDHPGLDAPGMKDPIREGIKGRILRTKAQHISVGDGFGRYAEDVADHPSHTGIGATKGLDCGGVVVGFDLERYFELVIEGQDAGVVSKGRQKPGGLKYLGGAADIGVEQIVHYGWIRKIEAFSNQGDTRFKRFMDAVFAPSSVSYTHLTLPTNREVS